MERNLYPENFEKFLKAHADQFKMSPSKKTWHGIYNDLHPGRRWPSVAMSMFFIFTLVIIGHLNTNNGRNTLLHNIGYYQNPESKKPLKSSETVKHFEGKRSVNTNTSAENIVAGDNQSNSSIQLSVIENIQPSPNSTSYFPTTKSNSVLENKNETFLDNITAKNVPVEISKVSLTDDELISSQNLTDTKSEEIFETIKANPNNEISLGAKEANPDLVAKVNTKKIRKSSVTWTYYVSPSISYRNFSDEEFNNSVNHKPKIGYEVGTAMSFNIQKKLQFTTGFQINYSGYNIKANNTHPIVSTLSLNTSTPGFYNTYSTVSRYGNNTGTELTTLKNYSLQASLPIGLQYKFGGNENVTFGAAASLQPSYIMASRGYLLSTDKRNYMTDAELFRKWNMNTSLSTYVSFVSNSLNWQIGPQVRYQLLSTFSNRYPVKENLINYGIRVSISKISK